jgi:hypothetical protein
VVEEKENVMPRNKDVDVEEVDVEEVAEAAEKAPKAKKEKARGDLPEGVVTPVGFAKILGERGLQKNREGVVIDDVKPQMVYSYIKNASKEDPFPLVEVEDSLGKVRHVVNVEDGVNWWIRKNERAALRSQNAAVKAEKKAANAAAKAETVEAEGEPTEAE